MADVVVTVPKRLWAEWLNEGDLPGEPWSGMAYHFWISPHRLPNIVTGERVYVVAHDKLRGYAPLVEIERSCRIWPSRACLLRLGEAVAVTINCYEVSGCAYGSTEHPAHIRGFRGWRYRNWSLAQEIPFPDWRS